MDKKRIMVIDDEEHFLKMVKLNLELTGRYEVLALSTAKDILAHVRSFGPKIILLDIRMPGVDGIQACEILNNDSQAKDIPVIIISGSGEDELKLQAYSKGVVNYLTKPIDTNNLITKIEKVIGFA